MSDPEAESILKYCIDSLADVLSLTAPANMARVQRIGRVSAAIGAMCGVINPEHLARLAFASQLGTLTLPETVVLKMHRGRLLTDDERRMLRALPDLGGQLLSRIPGLEADGEVVRLHDVHAVPDGRLPMEAAVLRVAIAYDRLEAGGKSREEAVAILRSRDPMYDSVVLDVLEQYGPETPDEKLERVIRVKELVPHMVLTRDIIGSDGGLRLGAGQELTSTIILRLSILAQRHIIRETVLVASASCLPPVPVATQPVDRQPSPTNDVGG